MIEERDITWVALPFAAGVISASLIPFADTQFLAAPALLISFSALLSAGHFNFRRSAYPIQVAVVAAAIFSAGLLCHFTSSVTAACNLKEGTGLTGLASGLCRSFKSAADTIPFEHGHTSAMIKAFITGDRSSLPAEVQTAFRASGAAHILALSGLHLGIIYAMISFCLKWLGNTRNIILLRSIITTAACGIYTAATGAGESITRAFIFIFIREAATILNRKASLTAILPASLIIQLTLEPHAIGSVSFQLSYAAMAGIAYIFPVLQDFWPDDGPRSGPFRKIWENAAVAISCQLTTAPLAWRYFHSFPHQFLISNLTALPLTGVIIPLSIATVILHEAGLCPGFIIRLTDTAITLLIDLLTAAADI